MKTFKINTIGVDQLLELYQHYNFLYPAKLDKLAPVLPLIKENLSKAFELPEHIYRLLTHYDQGQKEFSSIAAWRYTPSSMIIQHLVSNHPLKTRELFLYHILKLAGLKEKGRTEFIMTYYQRKTKFVHRMFNSLYQGQVRKSMLLEPFQYFKYDFQPLALPSDGRIEVTELQERDYWEFKNLVLQERGALYFEAMALQPESLYLQELNKTFRQQGLDRGRTIFVAKDRVTGTLCAILILNRGSVGLHFSLIENSSEIILDEDQSSDLLLSAARRLLSQASMHYCMHESPINFIPLLVKSTQAYHLQKLPLELQREYYLMICHQVNFTNWIVYLFQEYEKSLHYIPTSSKLNLVH